MPPDSWSGNWLAASSRPTRPSISWARSSRSAFATPWISSPKATFSITVRWASRPKCWKTIDTVWRRSSTQLGRVGRHHVVSGDPDLPGARLDQADEGARERGLARAREAHHHEHLAGEHLDRHVAHRHDAAGLLAQLGSREVGLGRADDPVPVRPEHLPHPLGAHERLVPAREVPRRIDGSRGRIAVRVGHSRVMIYLHSVAAPASHPSGGEASSGPNNRPAPRQLAAAGAAASSPWR